MTDPPLLRPDEPQDDLTRSQNRELARRQALAGQNRPSSGGGAGFMMVLPWLLAAGAVVVLAMWFSARTVGLRELLAATPLEGRLAVAPDDPAGDPGAVAAVLAAAVAAVGAVVTVLRWLYCRQWFVRGGRAVTLRAVVYSLTLLRSLIVIVGIALVGVAGGVARGADLDPAFRPADVSGWWPWVIVAASCVWLSLGSARRTIAKVAARIEAFQAKLSPL